MREDDISIVRQTEDRKLDAVGQAVPFIRVEFKVGNHGPFVEKFDKATFTGDIRDRRLNEFAREIR